MTSQPMLAFNDGRSIPQLGFGVFQMPADETAALVRTAIGTGYRHIDTAAIYKNEEGVGEAVRSCGVDRGDLFITTKLWNEDQGYDSALKACEQSLGRLGLDHVDLYLIHWPSPHRNSYVDSWRALVRLREEGRVTSIGVSNFQPEHLERIIGETGVTPVINQVELHPRFQQRELRAVHERLGTLTESWSPLGRGPLLEDDTLIRIAQKHGRTPAQIVLRWHLDNKLVVIPKSATPSRIASNFAVFDFALDAEDKAAIDRMDDRGGRIGPDPMTAEF